MRKAPIARSRASPLSWTSRRRRVWGCGTDTVPESGSVGKPRTRQAHAGTSLIHSVIAVRAGTGQDTRRGRGDQGGQPVAAATDASRVGHQVQEAGQCDRVRQRDRRGSPAQLGQRGGHGRRGRSRHGLARCSWDFDTHMITETVPALRPPPPEPGLPLQRRASTALRTKRDHTTAPEPKSVIRAMLVTQALRVTSTARM